jgi:hypothetical protein
VREKLKTILRDKWIPPDTEMSVVICLPCFHLVDQFDVLENQLQNIRDNLAAKYVSTNGINKQKSPEPLPPPAASSSNSDSSDDDRSASPVVTTTRGRKSGTVKIPKRLASYNRKEKTPKRKRISAEARKSAAEARRVAAEMKKAAALAKKAAAEAKKAALEAKREKARVGLH